jgi:4-amino-4-deoxy-L-arabinose transferase-like glycosyltransferase
VDRVFLHRALYCILALGLFVRLFHLTAPVADRHSWKQIAMAMVVRHYLEDGIAPLHPQWDIIIGDDNGPVYQAQESPLYYVTVAVLCKLLGPQEPITRLFSIAWSLIGAVFLFRLTRRRAGGRAALFAAFFYLLAPLSWYQGRTLQAESFMGACLIIAMERFDLFAADPRDAWLLQSGLALLVAAQLKPYALHAMAPMAVWLALQRGWRALADRRLATVAALVILPEAAWLAWGVHLGSLGNVVPRGGPGGPLGIATRLFAGNNLFGSWQMLASGKFWFVLQARIFDQMATPIVSVLALLALILPAARRQAAFGLVWLLGPVVYVLLVRDGNYIHNYYQFPFIAPFAMLAGVGLATAAERWPGRWVAIVLVAFAVMAALYVRTSFYLDMASVRAGELARQYSAPNDLIVAVDPGVDRNNQVIYAAHRRGWHFNDVPPDLVDVYRRRGAKWIAVCLDKEQMAKHPEWRARLGGLPRVAAETGFWGSRGEWHLVELYRLTPTAR